MGILRWLEGQMWGAFKLGLFWVKMGHFLVKKNRLMHATAGGLAFR